MIVPVSRYGFFMDKVKIIYNREDGYEPIR